MLLFVVAELEDCRVPERDVEAQHGHGVKTRGARKGRIGKSSVDQRFVGRSGRRGGISRW